MPSEDDASEETPTSLPGRLGRLNGPMLVQFVKFGIVGVSNTLLAFTIYTVLLKVFGVWYLGASAIGFVIGAVNGFLLNRRWTFAGHVGDSLTPVRWASCRAVGWGSTWGSCTCSSMAPASRSCSARPWRRGSSR
jgi:hypothetical protein